MEVALLIREVAEAVLELALLLVKLVSTPRIRSIFSQMIVNQRCLTDRFPSRLANTGEGICRSSDL